MRVSLGFGTSFPATEQRAVSQEGNDYLVMEYLEGETLKERIGRGAIPASEAIDLAMQVAQGLRKAHAAGIVHPDIKPANLFVTADDIVKILDFGVAKLAGQDRLTRTGLAPGTLAYMSPEQIEGAEADERSDLWALGVVLYEMLTGQHPFCGGHEAAVLHAVLNEAPRPAPESVPDIPEQLGRY